MTTRPPDAQTAANDPNQTTVGNVFVSNYPPYSFWSADHVPALLSRLEKPAADPEFGLYVHLPFCRKRCDFCYYKVYTDKNASEIRRYLDALNQEARLYAEKPFFQDRKVRLVYFGGGTPSYLSASQLDQLFDGLRGAFAIDGASEITFECEPGTLQNDKIETLRKLGVTRLSLGVENFTADILEQNNRAHRAKEIYTAYQKARDVGFEQINIDLIAGMVGETDDNWKYNIAETLRLRPESVTIYQIEIPYNTTIYQRMKGEEKRVAPVADWATKRRWTNEAFVALEEAGYSIGSGYTAKLPGTEFLYRDSLFTGRDLLGIGVSSFSHLGTVHAQAEHEMGPYVTRVEAGELPILRGYPLDREEQMIREFVLQLKLGTLALPPFTEKFGVDIKERFKGPLGRHQAEGFLVVNDDEIVLSREGLLQVDQLLHDYFLDHHRGARYA